MCVCVRARTHTHQKEACIYQTCLSIFIYIHRVLRLIGPNFHWGFVVKLRFTMVLCKHVGLKTLF